MQPTKAGLSLIEASIMILLVSVVLVKVAMIVQASSRAGRANNDAMAIEDQTLRVMDQIAYSVMGAARDTVTPSVSFPAFASHLRYEVVLGVEDGEVVWGEPESLRIGEDERKLLWHRNPGEENERRVAWCNVLRPYLEGEISNGKDDNGNGLIDERGLSFTMDRDSVTVRITLERTNADGQPTLHHEERTVTCRN